MKVNYFKRLFNFIYSKLVQRLPDDFDLDSPTIIIEKDENKLLLSSVLLN